ncbi:glycosyltransferase [Kitasatospora sp. NPDC088346]|uniref:glycosyltransferase n=1 Tax=Kitasatospora sp. NPDC088346 TaxID=3364073 RepID=UPI0038168831
MTSPPPVVPLAAPTRVVELDLARPDEIRTPGGLRPAPTGRVLALVRRHGHPLGLVTATGPVGDPAALPRVVAEAARSQLGAAAAADPAPEPPAAATPVSVIVCTRDREDLLEPCLDAVLRTTHPRTELIVVDNAPSDDATERLVRSRYGGRVRYLREPVAGLARARNTGLAAAHGELCVFTDDDALADPGWVPAMVAAFRADDRIGCVTGLVLPAELDTEAQAAFERYGGYTKGFTARTWSLREHPRDPLLPLRVGGFGTGANMAFRTDLLRRIGGFDTATGAGTRTCGGEDLLAFFAVLEGGGTVAYRPDAIVWHRHRRTMDGLAAQVYGFGVGFGAYLAAAVARRPALLGTMVRHAPRCAGEMVRRRRTRAARNGGRAPGELGRLELRGMVRGPHTYLLSRWQQRGNRVGEPS